MTSFREKTAKMVIPVQLDNLALVVMLVRMVLLAPKVLPVLLARTENVVLQVRLALVVSKCVVTTFPLPLVLGRK